MDANQTVIEVSNATVRFNMARQQVDNLKEYMIRLVKKELMFHTFKVDLWDIKTLSGKRYGGRYGCAAD